MVKAEVVRGRRRVEARNAREKTEGRGGGQ